MSPVTRDWALMASHGVVLFYIAANPQATMREMADALGLTERRIARIIKDLAEAGMLRVERIGRRNVYAVNPNARFRHPTLSHIPLSRFVEAIKSADGREAKKDGRDQPKTGAVLVGLLLSLELLATRVASFPVLA